MAGKTVCVTGAGGFIASWLVRRLLSGGAYAVHGTMIPKNDHLRALDGAGERLRLFGADVLNYASCGVSPPNPVMVHRCTTQVELLAPAVAGTLKVLRACRKAGVRRVVVVSSVGAVFINPNLLN